jgi:isochorismate pyruvate lyase
MMKTPEQCGDLSDIRQAIDTLDQRIIESLGQRLAYVHAASRFKPDEAAIPAPDRVAAMLPVRRQWGEAAGLDGQFVVPLYAQIIQWFIGEQIRYWRSQRQRAPSTGETPST